jgi:general secretion pathway protein G
LSVADYEVRITSYINITQAIMAFLQSHMLRNPLREEAYGIKEIPWSCLGTRGFTLIELLIVIAIIGTLSGIAVPMYASYVNQARVTKAKIEIKSIEREILTFYSENDRYPESLAEIGFDGILDPYGNPYQYLPAPADDKGNSNDDNNNNKGGNKGGETDADGSGGDKAGSTGGGDDGEDGTAKAKMRKDHNLVPVNTDFDLYSMGKDGESRAPFTAKVSHDDIVRANNGQFIGLVSNY